MAALVLANRLRDRNDPAEGYLSQQSDGRIGLLIDSPGRFWRNQAWIVQQVRALCAHLKTPSSPCQPAISPHILREAATDLEALRSKRLFLTGGTGFFGKWLLAGLGQANAELGLDLRVTVLSRDPEAFLRIHPELANVRGLQFMRGDVVDFPLENQRYDFILHAAADTAAFTNAEEERHRSRSIVEGTRQVLDLAKRSGVTRLLNVSSGAVYGALAGQLSGAREDDFAAAQPLNAYAAAKREAEQLCAESGVEFVTARAFAFLGPYLPLDAHFAAGNFLRDARRGGPILVRGDGTALRSYLYPADLVVWLLRLLRCGQGSRAYNVGSDEVISTAQLAHAIARAVQPSPEVIIQSVQPQGPQNIYLPDTTRARAELNLNVDISLPEAIARTLAFLESNRG